MKSLPAAALILGLVSLPLCAQEQKFVESIEVRVANIDVVVTDKAGNPVHGLTRDDFQLLENGQPQPLTNFYEIRGDELTATATAPAPGTPTTAPPAEPTPPELLNRRFVIFLDDYSLPAFKRKSILTSLGKFIDSELRPGDTATLVEWIREIHVVVPFTGSKTALHEGIRKLSGRLTSATAESEENQIKQNCIEGQASERGSRGMRGQAQTTCFTEVDFYEERARATMKDLLADLRRTTVSLAGVDGKKVLILAGTQLPERPGLELRHFAQTLFGGAAAIGRAVLDTPSARMSIDDFARAANANGVTIYAIDAQEGQHGVTSENDLVPDATEDFFRFTNSAASYRAIASITGGKAVTNMANFDQAFETVARDLTSYYSLGYRPHDSENTHARRITIRMKDHSLTARARATFTLKTADEQVGDRVIANLFHQGITGPWDIHLRTGPPKKDGRNYRVPVQLTLPPTVTLLPQGNELVGGFSVYLAVGEASGRMSDVSKRPQTIRIPVTAETQLRSKPFVFTADVMMRPGENILSVAAVDTISNDTGFARTIVAAK